MRKAIILVALGVCVAASPAIACPDFPPPEQDEPGGPNAWTVTGRLNKAPPPTKRVPIPDGSLNTVKIALRRSACFGSCPEYTVVIGGDGTVRYHGERSVLVQGDHLTKVSIDDIRCLLEDFRKSDFWSLRPSYFAPVTDNPGYDVTLEIGGQLKTVHDYVGRAVGMPKEVTGLEQAIDRLGGDEWVVGNQKTVAALKAEQFDFRSADALVMIMQALNTGSDEVVLDLLAAGAPTKGVIAGRIDLNASSLASAASARKTPVVLRTLFERGALDEKGAAESALISAARRGRPDNVREVLAHHPDINFRENADGPTALIEASGGYDGDDGERRERQVQILRLLLAAGADPKAHMRRGGTALHNAESVEAMRLLIEAGADVNARDEDGYTPLSWARHDDEAVFLLEAGADPNVRMQSGGKLSDQARTGKWVKTLVWLGAHGAPAASAPTTPGTPQR